MHCDLPCLPNVGHCICLRPPAVDEREAPARRQSSLQGIVYVSSGSSVYQLGPAVDMDFHGLEVSHLPCWLARHSDSAPLVRDRGLQHEMKALLALRAMEHLKGPYGRLTRVTNEVLPIGARTWRTL